MHVISGGILQMDVDVGEVIINENLILEPPDLLVPYTDERMRALGYPTERTEEPRSRSPSPAPSIESVKEEHSEQTQNHNDSTNDEDEGRLCPICLDNWTNTGEHRVCSLKCGHLFGLKCVNRWISSQTRKSCPTCKKRVIKSDIRNIYAKKLIAIDTSEIEIVKEQLEKVTEEKNRVQMELTKALCREHLLKQQVSDLKTEMHGLQQTLECRKLSQLYTVEKSENASKMKMRFYMDKSLELCSSNGCRVLASNPHLDLVVASVKSPNTLFTGYGVRKVSISHYRTTAFIPLHSAAIRDLVFHPVNDWIATVSIDKSFKIVDGNTNSVAFSVTCESQLWSCCWDTSNSNVFYAGAQQGSVYKYDIRRIREVVCTYNVPGDMSPVVSVAAVCGGPGEPLTHGGIVSCKLNSIWVFENAGEDYVRHCLPIEGPFVCMRYEFVCFCVGTVNMSR